MLPGSAAATDSDQLGPGSLTVRAIGARVDAHLQQLAAAQVYPESGQEPSAPLTADTADGIGKVGARAACQGPFRRGSRPDRGIGSAGDGLERSAKEWRPETALFCTAAYSSEWS